MSPSEQAISKWGERSQINQCKEELAELIVALSHWERKKAIVFDVFEEIADVEIMLEQMKLIFFEEHDKQKNLKTNASDVFQRTKNMKLDRLKRKLNV